MRRLAFLFPAILAVVPLLAVGCAEGNPADEAVVILTEPAAEGDGAAEAVPAPDAGATPAAP